MVLTIPAGPARALGSLALLIAGLVAVVVLQPFWDTETTARWRGPALTALAIGLLPAVVWTVVGGPGWGSRLAVTLGTSLWVASAEFERPAGRPAATSGPGLVAPLLAFGGLLALSALGYLARAGLPYFLGQPLALVAVLAGRYAGTQVAERSDGLETTGYLIAAIALILAAWVDLA